MYPTTPVGGLDRLLAITVLAISWTDIALAALAYQNDVGSTVRARSIIEPWTITIAAIALAFVPVMVRRGDGLVIAYVISMVAALVAAIIPLIKCYGIPHGGSRTCRSLGEPQCAMRRSPRLTWSSGRRAGSTWRCSARSCRQAWSASIMRRSRSATLPAELKTGFEPVLGPADHPGDRRRRPSGHSEAGAAGDLLDNCRTARDRAGAGDSRARCDGAFWLWASRPAPRCLPSCSRQR